MSTPYLLSLPEVCRLTGLAGTTVRRYIKEGKIKAEPRVNDQQQYWVSLENLEASGFPLVAEPRGDDAPVPDSAVTRRLRAEVDAYRAQVEALQREKVDLVERAARAEGALEVAREQLEQWSQRTRRTDSPSA